MRATPSPVVDKVFPEIVAPVVLTPITLQVMVLLVASAGATVPERVRASPAVAEVGRPVMPVTGTKAGLTEMEKSCV